jgi:hypothetical protein
MRAVHSFEKLEGELFAPLTGFDSHQLAETVEKVSEHKICVNDTYWACWLHWGTWLLGKQQVHGAPVLHTGRSFQGWPGWDGIAVHTHWKTRTTPCLIERF